MTCARNVCIGSQMADVEIPEASDMKAQLQLREVKAQLELYEAWAEKFSGPVAQLDALIEKAEEYDIDQLIPGVTAEVMIRIMKAALKCAIEKSHCCYVVDHVKDDEKDDDDDYAYTDDDDIVNMDEWSQHDPNESGDHCSNCNAKLQKCGKRACYKDLAVKVRDIALEHKRKSDTVAFVLREIVHSI